MPDIYVVKDDGLPVPLSPVHCHDEGAELQHLLTANPNLLPGDQISPEDPCRWLLVGHEVPVQDPSTGDDRWSIDVVLVDQNATPTFAECKRFLNTQARREVVGQMLEYAANGHYYWTADSLRELAAKTAGRGGTSLEQRLATLVPESEGSPSEFFARVESNLREGQIRLIFFLEQAPQELKSIVDFLNRQMERAEVLIVEARQFEINGMRVIAPALFGYTEQARMVKRSVTVNLPGRRNWNEETYFADVRERLEPSSAEALQRLLRFLMSSGCAIRWGTGRVTGSFSAVPKTFDRKSLLTAYSNGSITLNLVNMAGNQELDSLRQRFVEGLQSLQIEVPQDQVQGYFAVKIANLAPKLVQLEKLISAIIC